MADLTKMSPSEISEEHAAEAHAPYLKVWFALAVLTAVEYFYASWFQSVFIILLVGLLFWAIIKAGLVGWYFMHLKFEGNWVYILIVPAFVLATILVLALMPDIGMRAESEETAPEETSFVAPAPAGQRFWVSLCAVSRNAPMNTERWPQPRESAL
jgi:cytochrome c oxidase subunit 4